MAERLASAHHRPRDPRHLVGDRNRDHARRTPLEERVGPGRKLGLVAAMADHGGRAEHEELAQIRVALLRDLPHMDLAAGPGLPRHQTDPAGQVPPGLEGLDVADGGGDGGGRDHADSGIVCSRRLTSLARCFVRLAFSIA